MNQKESNQISKSKLKLSALFAVILAVALILLLILESAVRIMAGKIGFLDAGKRWSSDGSRFAVCTYYTEKETAVPVDQALSWANSIDNALLEASVTPKSGARSWAYCYGTAEKLTVSGSVGTATAAVTVAGGDFFVFHPLSFTFGAPFMNDTSNPTGVVLDRDLAWKLFGAENIVGFTVVINDVEFTVTGVSEKTSRDPVYEKTYGDMPRMYMSAAGYAKVSYNENFVTFFEAALPNAVRGFAWNIFSPVIGNGSYSSVSLEASDRYSLKNRYDKSKSLAYSMVQQNTIEFPYWENEARVYDYKSAKLIPWEIGIAAVGVISFLASFICLRISGWTLIGTVKNTVKKAKKNKRAISENV